MKKFIIFSFLTIARSVRNLLSLSGETYKALFTPGFENYRWGIGKWKAWQVFENAKKEVPAYKDFLFKNSFTKINTRGWNPNLSEIPIMDKESYIKKYSIEERCVNGKIPDSGVVIDESSGTSGTPNNWVRGSKERASVKRLLQLAIRYGVGDKPFFVLNAFALGPWATGMNVSMSIVDICVLKSTGPDIKKIENTLKTFGPKYNYVITGYPPFLKTLVDKADINWADFNIIAIFGGEGISEGMRDYLLKSFKNVYGSYGASDLEINIASENGFTIALRKLISEKPEVASKILKIDKSSLPMIFQYNPLDYYIETNEKNELIVTLCRTTNVSPKIRYNIHDRGFVMRWPELIKVLGESNTNLDSLSKLRAELPLLFHYGRADMAVAFFGCKITPVDIEEIVYKNKTLAELVNSFSLITFEDDKLNKKLVLALELSEGKEDLKTKMEELTVDIFQKLKDVNQDYREISAMIPAGSEPKIEIHSFGTGPFKSDDIRLKKHYIQKR